MYATLTEALHEQRQLLELHLTVFATLTNLGEVVFATLTNLGDVVFAVLTNLGEVVFATLTTAAAADLEVAKVLLTELHLLLDSLQLALVKGASQAVVCLPGALVRGGVEEEVVRLAVAVHGGLYLEPCLLCLCHSCQRLQARTQGEQQHTLSLSAAHGCIIHEPCLLCRGHSCPRLQAKTNFDQVGANFVIVCSPWLPCSSALPATPVLVLSISAGTIAAPAGASFINVCSPTTHARSLWLKEVAEQIAAPLLAAHNCL